MGYADVHNRITQPRAAGDILGRIEVAFTGLAARRSAEITDTDDQRERAIARRVIVSDGLPRAWMLMVLARIDAARKALDAATDADIDAAVAAVWEQLIKVWE